MCCDQIPGVISAFSIGLTFPLVFVANPNLKVISVDPSIIPLGSKVWVEGYGEAIAADTGGAIKGNKIDVFISNKEAASNWGRRTVTIKILN